LPRLPGTDPGQRVKSAAGLFFNAMREKLPGLRAFFLLGSGGELLAHVSEDRRVDSAGAEVFASEYATLLRIAQSASRDTGMGDLQEQILATATSLIVIHCFSRDRVAVFVCSPDEHLGRLRYELKRSLLYSSLSNI
jgi:predicted regulator of Ras-like GTPase activity (Roadblock/LC7/MglB family)